MLSWKRNIVFTWGFSWAIVISYDSIHEFFCFLLHRILFSLKVVQKHNSCLLTSPCSMKINDCCDLWSRILNKFFNPLYTKWSEYAYLEVFALNPLYRILTPFLLLRLILHPFLSNKSTIAGLFLVTAVKNADISCLVRSSIDAPSSINNSTILISLKWAALIKAVSPFLACSLMSEYVKVIY